MIIADFSQLFIANIHIDPQFSSLAKNPTEENRNFLMHMTLNGIRAYVMKYKKDFGNMVIAVDGKNTWRREYFPHYKCTREVARAASDIDWDYVFSVGNDIKDALRTKLPFPVIGMDGAEADDVIACLVKHVSETTADDSDDFGGMFSNEPEPIMILSSDGDFKQLHKYKNVKQFSPMQKKLVTCKNPKAELIEKILRGDAGDAIPNARSPASFFRDKIDNPEKNHRQASISEKFVIDVQKNPDAYPFSADERANYIRNETLISFDKIPVELYNKIVAQYKEQENKKVSKMELMNFFISKRLNMLNENIQDFFL